jgi:hypothetical protein
LPYNFFGYIIQSTMRLFASNDTTSVACYIDPKTLAKQDAAVSKKFLRELPARPGGRHELLPWVAPQRQVGSGSPKEIRDVSSSFESVYKYIADISVVSVRTI